MFYANNKMSTLTVKDYSRVIFNFQYYRLFLVHLIFFHFPFLHTVFIYYSIYLSIHILIRIFTSLSINIASIFWDIYLSIYLFIYTLGLEFISTMHRSDLFKKTAIIANVYMLFISYSILKEMQDICIL